MNKKIKAEWVKALRSGEYNQGKYRLRTADNKFCCLGVLCNLHAQAHPELAATQADPYSYFEYKLGLPPIVRQWAGLKDAKCYNRNTGVSLAELNDNGSTFKQIANIIEKEL